ncbi:MAG: ABC transporter ATP-binding protein [Ruminococcus sp.]|nr:ABC transporter ATP-binding protein [Ruminococcus sp.]MBQ8296220.1 ABC transporter ATP-binding protein [Ruminococcus sp.]
MITIENLTKFYGKNRAVNNISFTINDNEILGFLGPNGAGKSTTMNMIAGYLPMSAGTVTIFGTDISKEPTKAKQNIGYLPEIPPVYPDMKVKEYLSFCAGLKKVPRSQRASEIERVMELLKITDMKSRLIKNLSKGYKQRVGFAQALLGNPKFLILDEPTVGLDPNQVAEVRQIIKDLKKEHSVIFSSHILSEVSAVCDRVVIINKGDIKAIDTIENLESTFKDNLFLNARVAGRQEQIVSVTRAVPGVKSIAEINPVSDGVYEMRIALEGNADEIRTAVMSALLANNIQILEIFTEKPNLENIFIELINQPAKRSSLQDIVDELKDDADSSDDAADKEEA